MITVDLLERRIRTFWGYGSFAAPVWLVGIEEGLGDVDDGEFLARLHATDGKQMVDVRQDMKEIPDHIKFFDPDKPRSQTSLRYPIALYLCIKNGAMPEPNEVKEYQAVVAGDRRNPDSAIIELMPLPAKSIKEIDWPYAKYNVTGLETRATYLAKYKSTQVKKLRKLISQYKPKFVVFSSLLYKNEWTAVAGVELRCLTGVNAYVGRNRSTIFCVIPHGASRGMISYDKVKKIASQLPKDLLKL